MRITNYRITAWAIASISVMYLAGYIALRLITFESVTQNGVRGRIVHAYKVNRHLYILYKPIVEWERDFREPGTFRIYERMLSSSNYRIGEDNLYKAK